LNTAKVPPADVVLGDRDTLHLFSDARECDQPGYVDCPTNELDQTGRSAGRTEALIPVSQLLGRSTVVTLHPPVCPAGADCPEDKNPVGLCPQGCYSVTYRIDDLAAGSPAVTPTPVVLGASIRGFTTYGPDQEEENVTIAAIISELRARGRLPKP
jgi:hypothetical protein